MIKKKHMTLQRENLLSDLPISLEGFLEEVSLIADVDGGDSDPNRVVMMTLHSAKGLEFPIVFMAGMEEGLFPSAMSADDDEELEEERRLCYVGMTRAEKKLYMTFAAERMIHGERKIIHSFKICKGNTG